MNTLFQVSNQAAVYNERVAIILGFVSLVLALAVFASCRIVPSLIMRLGMNNLTQCKVYQGFNKYHAYYWWFFGVSVLAHVMMSTVHTGLPQAGDPDATVHWIILVFGVASAFSSVALFSSCRISPRLLAHSMPRLSLTNKTYVRFSDIITTTGGFLPCSLPHILLPATFTQVFGRSAQVKKLLRFLTGHILS